MWLYAAAAAVYLCSMSASTVYGWSSPALPLLKNPDSPVQITDDEGSWIVSIYLMGVSIGPMMSLLVAELIGRKTMLIVSAVPWLIGWSMITFASSVWELMFSRFICGIGSGVCFSVVPMYLGEISPPKVRGILLTIIMTASRLGILFEYIITPFVSIRTGSLIVLSLPTIFILYFVWMPESPYYWMRRGRRDKAAKSLIQLRGSQDIQEELDLIETSVNAEMAKSAGFKEIFIVPGNRKSFTIGLVLGLIQQMSASQAILLYSQTIFDKADVNLEGRYLAMILGGVQVICTLICAAVIDRYGRRPLLLTSAIGSFVNITMVAVYFHLQHMNVDTHSIEWLPASGCMFYIVFFALGLSPIPTGILGELFPTNIKYQGCAIIMLIINIGGFIVSKAYQVISDTAGTHVSFWIFTCIAAFAVLYIYFCVPETKGKTLQQIQEELHNEKGPGKTMK